MTEGVVMEYLVTGWVMPFDLEVTTVSIINRLI